MRRGEGGVNLMCPGTKAIGGGGGRGWGGGKDACSGGCNHSSGGAEGTRRPVCLVAGGEVGGAANLRRHSPSPRIKPTHKRLNLHDGICKAAKSSVSPD